MPQGDALDLCARDPAKINDLKLYCNDPHFILRACLNNEACFGEVAEKFRSDPELVCRLAERCPMALRFARKDALLACLDSQTSMRCPCSLFLRCSAAYRHAAGRASAHSTCLATNCPATSCLATNQPRSPGAD